MLIYRATNTVNGKTYIGATTQPFVVRLRQHKCRAKTHGMPLYAAIRKYGWKAFKWEIVRECAAIEELKRAEQEEIVRHNSVAGEGWGYNRTRGGDGVLGLVFSEGSRAKLRAARARWVMPPEQRLRQSLALRGRPLPPSASRKGVKLSPETIAKRSATRRARRLARMEATLG